MEKIKVGFFKIPQGAFSVEVIEEIKNRLRENKKIEFFDELDYRQFYVKNDRVFMNDFNLNELNVYFWHDSVKPMSWGGDNYFLNVLNVLEKDCLVINSSFSTRVTSDKFLAHSILKRSNLPVVEFALVHIDNREALLKVFSDFNKEVLIKPRFGGWGTGVLKIDSEDQLFSSLELTKSFLNNPDEQQVLIEKYYPNDLSKWISVSIFGDKVLLGYRKKIKNKEGWKIYDPFKKGGQGADADYVEPSEELREIALKASEAIGKDIIGFDFIFTKEGYKIVDENARPGLYKHCLQSAGIEIVDETATLILNKVEKISKSGCQ